MAPLHLWRFDGDPALAALAESEASALGAGEALAPSLYLGETPFAPGRAGLALAGGEVLAQGAPGAALPLPAGAERLHVPKGPFYAGGNPAELTARLGARPGPRRTALHLYATPGRWLLVRCPPPPWEHQAPALVVRTSTSLPARVARALVHLVARPGERLLDLVCGTGLVLVEAARIGCLVRGADLNPKALRAARANLAALGLPGEVRLEDALAGPGPGEEPADALVGDLPYGRRLEPHDLAPLCAALPPRARRWALVAPVDLSGVLCAAGHPPRRVLRVPKPTFCRFVHLGGEALGGP